MRRLGLLSLLACTVLCTACSVGSSSWKKNQDTGLGVKISYPASFQADALTTSEVANGRNSYSIQQVRLQSGTQSTISILRSDSPELLASLTTQAPLQPVQIGGRMLRQFQMSNELFGYVFQDQPVIAVAFKSLTDPVVVTQVVQSVNIEK